MLPDKVKWTKEFLQSDRYKSVLAAVYQIQSQIVIDFDGIISGDTGAPNWTPRFSQLRSGTIHVQPFYILDFIDSLTKETIYDIGCGHNFFKQFYNVTGIDPYTPQADITDEFDDSFMLRNKGSFTNIFSINAIHFCKLRDIENRVRGYFDLVKPGGFAYLAINMERLLDYTFGKLEVKRRSYLDKLYPDGVSKGVDKTFEKILSNSAYDVILYENLIDKNPDEYINGNIRILIKRK